MLTVKIAIITEHINQRGGQEQVLAELVSRLAKRHQVDVFCFSAADISRGRIRVHRLWCPFKSSTVQALWMVLVSPFVIRQDKYDVVLSQGGNSLVRNFVLVHTCHAERARALGEVRWKYQRPSWLVRLGWIMRQAWATRMEGWAVRRCQGRVLAVSQMVVRYLAQEHGLTDPPGYAVPNGLNHDIFNLAARRRFRSSRREALQAGPEEFIILFAGGLWFDKGLPLVIDALAMMQFPAKLVVVGRGDQEFFARLAEQRGVAAGHHRHRRSRRTCRRWCERLPGRPRSCSDRRPARQVGRRSSVAETHGPSGPPEGATAFLGPAG